MDRLADFNTDLYLITDTAMAARAGRTVAETVAQAIAGGVGIVQVRDKTLDDADFKALTLSVIDAVEQARQDHDIDYDIPVVLNDRVHLAAELLESGVSVHVHVGQSDLAAHRVRELIGPEPLLGVSAQTPQHFQAARDQDVDLLGVGPIWETQTKDTTAPVLGPEGFADLIREAGLPAFAIGGITTANAHLLHGTEAAGICAVSAIMAAPDPRAAAAQLRRAFTTGS